MNVIFFKCQPCMYTYMEKERQRVRNNEINWITTVLTDGLAPNGARPSACTMMTAKSGTSPLKFLWLSFQ